MNVFKPNTILKKLEEELDALKIENIEKKALAEKSVGVCQLAFLELKKYVTQDGFNNTEEEITFFKIIKPTIFSKLIFYHELFRIETYKPLTHKKLMVKMLNNEIRKIHEFIKNNKEFYLYYTTNQTCLDDTYFTRSNISVLVGSEYFHYLTDPQFATPKDEIVSYIIAYEQFGKYLDNEISILKNGRSFWQTFQPKSLNFEMSWTASKIALVELIYALHCCSCINNGRIQINELIEFFETVFDVKLYKAYRTFIDIKDRKREKTKFLTELKKGLTNMLDDLDALTYKN